jgi:chemosensory pili system protein ChpA (sensor histidine kinase/response regulator)
MYKGALQHHLRSERTVAKSILIVDDNQTVRTLTRHFLECQPAVGTCAEAVDGVDALEKTRRLNPDLIILDLAMPRMNGFEAARELRSFSQVPIILFTISAASIRDEEALATGVNVVVSKTDILSLEHHVNRLLSVR